jgi:hypothetical protein
MREPLAVVGVTGVTTADSRGFRRVSRVARLLWPPGPVVILRCHRQGDARGIGPAAITRLKHGQVR